MSNWVIDFTGVQGKFQARVNFGTAVVNRHSTVLANVVEIQAPQGQPLDFPMIGAADNMMIKNICPQDDGICRIVVDTDWTGGPINIRLRLVVDPA